MKLFIVGYIVLLGTALAVSETAALETYTGTLYGTLQVPPGDGPFPVALIHPGSGPTDRDGNSAGLPGKNNSLKLLAQSLAESGVASLRIDKRGIAQSANAGPREEELRFDTYIDDTEAWLKWLQQDERFNRIAVIGHSEGSLIGMIASRRAGADAFISIAGPGERASDTLRRQLSAQLPTPLLEDVDVVLKQLESGQTVETLPESIAQIPGLAQSLFRESVQPYLISWFAYDPAQEIAELRAPVLLVQGTTDLQVSLADAEALKAASPQAKLVVVENMNHVLKEAPTDPAQNQATYTNPDLPLVPGLAEAIVQFLKKSE